MNQNFVTSEACSQNTDKILDKLESIERRLFHDNGTLSIQTRLDRHEQVIRGILWALSVVGAALLVSLVSLVFLFVKYVVKNGGIP